MKKQPEDELTKNKRMILDDASARGETLEVNLFYPRNSPIKFLELGLMDVRASDSIRVSYDFARDGWKIEQASVFSWPSGDNACDSDWQEVAFVQAWNREEPEADLSK